MKLRILAVLALLAGLGAAFFPVGAPQGSKSPELVVPDATGDVSVQPGLPPVPFGTVADAVDLTEVKLYGETGELLRLSVKVKDLKAEANEPILWTQGLDVGACFKLGATQYGVLHNFLYGARQPPAPKIGVATGCNGAGITFGKSGTGLKVYTDLIRSEVLFIVPRTTLAALAGAPPPSVGAPVTELFAFVREHRVQGATRFDSAGPSTDTLLLGYPTANQDLRMVADVNSQPQPCGQNRDLPTYAIEAGGKRGIPVTVSNLAASPRQVTFAVRTIDGPDWKAKVMPGIEIPASDGSRPGNLTVNVIVDTPSGTKHRDCATILVRAVDAGDPLTAGETSVNVVAAVPPSPERRVLQLHADELAMNTCAGDHAWMNIEADDAAADTGKELLLNSCEDTVPLSLANSAMSFFLDVNPSRDLLLNTSATGKVAEAVVQLRSDGAPTRARVTAALIASKAGGPDQLGEGVVTVELGQAFTPVRFQIPITFTRDFVATGDPSRVVESTSDLGLAIRYEPVAPDPNANDVRPAGAVYLRPEGSQLTLPIWATVKRNVNDPGVSGALLGLKALGATEGFANPGKTRAFNFTILNEGAATDVAVVSATVAGGKAWAVQLNPHGPFTLDAGRHQDFVVGITPPADATESESVRIEVTVVSQSDATARSSTTLTLTATAGQELSADDIGVPLAEKKAGGIPASSAALALLVLLGAAWGLRRYA